MPRNKKKSTAFNFEKVMSNLTNVHYAAHADLPLRCTQSQDLELMCLIRSRAKDVQLNNNKFLLKAE